MTTMMLYSLPEVTEQTADKLEYAIWQERIEKVNTVCMDAILPYPYLVRAFFALSVSREGILCFARRACSLPHHMN